MGIVDEIIKEPLGGAHRDPRKTAEAVGESLKRNLLELLNIPVDELVKRRYERFRKIGSFEEGVNL